MFLPQLRSSCLPSFPSGPCVLPLECCPLCVAPWVSSASQDRSTSFLIVGLPSLDNDFGFCVLASGIRLTTTPCLILNKLGCLDPLVLVLFGTEPAAVFQTLKNSPCWSSTLATSKYILESLSPYTAVKVKPYKSTDNYMSMSSILH